MNVLLVAYRGITALTNILQWKSSISTSSYIHDLGDVLTLLLYLSNPLYMRYIMTGSTATNRKSTLEKSWQLNMKIDEYNNNMTANCISTWDISKPNTTILQHYTPSQNSYTSLLHKRTKKKLHCLPLYPSNFTILLLHYLSHIHGYLTFHHL